MAAFVVGGLILPARPAAASCAEESGPEGSPVVFVGTAEADRRGFTRFAVDEVLAGPDLAPEVWVRSGQEQPTWPLNLFAAVGSSADADFVDDERYVVGASRSFVTGACSVTEAGAGATTHPGAREPVEDGAAGVDPPTGPLGQTLWVTGGVAVVGAALAWRRRRRAARREATAS